MFKKVIKNTVNRPTSISYVKKKTSLQNFIAKKIFKLFESCF